MLPRPEIVAFSQGGRLRYGLQRQDGVIDLSRHFEREYPTLRQAVEAGALRGLAEKMANESVDFALTDISYEPPIPSCAKIICVGVNYPDRAEEYCVGGNASQYPSLFTRFAGSLVGHEVPLVRPRVSPQFDYEGEIALIIAKPGRHISESDALDHIAALTLCNEGSVRDWMRHGKFNVTQGKNFDRSGALGPWLVPYEDESQIADIQLSTRVNGEVRQNDRTSRMLFNFRRLIHYISTFTTLLPGDVIVTGTPTGAGARSNPPVWLKPGDVVEITADGIGTLRNGVCDEETAGMPGAT